MNDENSVKLENRLATIEAQIKHISNQLDGFHDLFKEHHDMDYKRFSELADTKLFLLNEISNISTDVKTNTLWIKGIIWVLGSAGILGGGVTGLLKILG